MSHPFKQWFKQYFDFSKKDRNAIVILSISILIILLLNIILDHIEMKSDFDHSEFEKALLEWEQFDKENGKSHQFLFSFDPNTISEKKLDTLLLADFIKRNLLSYRKAGGKITSKEDLRKIYGMNDSIYSAIENYIEIQNTIINGYQYLNVADNSTDNNNSDLKFQNEIVKSESTPIVELNSADSVDLVRLNGIGPVFAARIIKYRNLLGGFYAKNQLLEVYNFPKETYDNIEEYISVDTSLLKTIRINFADFSELLRHPYLNKEQVQAILNYREQNGAFNFIGELDKSEVLDSVTFNRIKPYLSCR